MFHHTGDRHQSQQEDQPVMFIRKAAQLGVGKQQKDQKKQQHTADHKETDVGTVDKKVLIPAGQVLCSAAEAVLLDLRSEQGKRMLPQGLLIHFQPADQRVLQLFPKFPVVSVKSQRDNKGHEGAEHIGKAHHCGSCAQCTGRLHAFMEPPGQSVDQKTCQQQKTAGDIRLGLCHHHDRTCEEKRHIFHRSQGL